MWNPVLREGGDSVKDIFGDWGSGSIPLDLLMEYQYLLREEQEEIKKRDQERQRELAQQQQRS